MRAFLNRLLLKKSIGDGRGNTFFFRYRVLETPWFGAYVHRFVRGDMDRWLHDHPWGFLAIVLRGGYWEEMFRKTPCLSMWPDGSITNETTEVHWRRPGSILWRPAKTAHRITIDETKPKPISLVFVGRKVRPWGFFTVDGWRPWKKGDPNPICETR